MPQEKKKLKYIETFARRNREDILKEINNTNPSPAWNVPKLSNKQTSNSDNRENDKK